MSVWIDGLDGIQGRYGGGHVLIVDLDEQQRLIDKREMRFP
jgi:hypothetical protein